MTALQLKVCATCRALSLTSPNTDWESMVLIQGRLTHMVLRIPCRWKFLVDQMFVNNGLILSDGVGRLSCYLSPFYQGMS
jgi:hypothetical protein